MQVWVTVHDHEEVPENVRPHPLLPILLAAAAGVFPPVDGRAVFLPALTGGLQAVVSFTGHAVLATSLTERDFTGLTLDGFGAALRPAVLQRLAGPDGDIGVVNATLVACGTGGGRMPVRTDLDDHPRVRHAIGLRQRVRVHGDHRGLVTLADGLAGRLEVSVEAFEQGTGAGRALIEEALQLVPAGEPAFAAVSPGNARSLRAFLAVGFRPLGSEVQITRRTSPS